MELLVLQKYVGKLVTLFLENKFQYTKVVFKINDSGLVEFKDRFGGEIVIEPSFVYAVMEMKNEEKRE